MGMYSSTISSHNIFFSLLPCSLSSSSMVWEFTDLVLVLTWPPVCMGGMRGTRQDAQCCAEFLWSYSLDRWNQNFSACSLYSFSFLHSSLPVNTFCHMCHIPFYLFSNAFCCSHKCKPQGLLYIGLFSRMVWVFHNAHQYLLIYPLFGYVYVVDGE